MRSAGTNLAIALGLAVCGVAIAVAGVYVGQTDDAPGAALLGIVLMVGAIVLAVRIARRTS